MPKELVEAIWMMLKEQNPFLHSVQRAIESTKEQSYSIRLDQNASGEEIAAVINAQNLAKI